MANLRKKSEYEIKDSKGGVAKYTLVSLQKDIVTFIGVSDNQPLVGKDYDKTTLQFSGFDGKSYHVVPRAGGASTYDPTASETSAITSMVEKNKKTPISFKFDIDGVKWSVSIREFKARGNKASSKKSAKAGKSAKR